MGLRDLVTGDLTHRDLLDYIRYMPRDSALARAVIGPAADWGVAEHMAANQVDLLAAANWQRSARKAGKPKPITRPRPPTSRG